ncbi:hypothetical protein C8R45DRAFT_1183141 [Mycena sanguinolenta]|nr:hypothetical protein C8R45DRAFT_1183141 [Mycena sanguinolenta]
MSPTPATIAGFLTSTSTSRTVSSPLEPEANLIALSVFLVDEELCVTPPSRTKEAKQLDKEEESIATDRGPQKTNGGKFSPPPRLGAASTSPPPPSAPNKHGGLIVGVALAVIATVFGVFLVRWLFVRRARRREAFAGPGRTLGATGATGKAGTMGQGGAPTTKEGMGMGAAGMGMPMPMPMRTPSERDAVELASYPPPTLPPSSSSAFPPSSSSAFPPSSASNPPFSSNTPPQLPPTHTTSGSWSTPFSGSGPTTTPFSSMGTGAEPGPNSRPAVRQAYLAAELRAAQSLLERAGGRLGDKSVDVKATKARIRDLEERQGSAWALGLE